MFFFFIQLKLASLVRKYTLCKKFIPWQLFKLWISAFNWTCLISSSSCLQVCSSGECRNGADNCFSSFWISQAAKGLKQCLEIWNCRISDGNNPSHWILGAVRLSESNAQAYEYVKKKNIYIFFEKKKINLKNDKKKYI